MLLPKTKRPAAPDEKLETFLMWTQVPDTTRRGMGFPAVIVFAAAAVVAVVIPVAAAGWV